MAASLLRVDRPIHAARLVTPRNVEDRAEFTQIMGGSSLADLSYRGAPLMRRIVIAAALLAAACGPSPQDSEKTATKSAAIIDGTASSVDQDSVVLITIGARGGCTGTLVAPNLVLTARHCVTETDGGALCKTDGTAYEGGGLGSNYPASALLVYKGQLAAAMADDPTKAHAKGKQLFVE